MTRPRKLLLWLVVLPVLLVALIVGLAFLPAVQTFVVHRALASRPEIKAEVQEVAVSDMADFERLHKDALTRLPGVARVNSSVAIRTVQKKTELPLRVAPN